VGVRRPRNAGDAERVAGEAREPDARHPDPETPPRAHGSSLRPLRHYRAETTVVHALPSFGRSTPAADAQSIRIRSRRANGQ
jgi:hypothetical protein